MSFNQTVSYFLTKNPTHELHELFEQVKKEKPDVHEKINFDARIFESPDGETLDEWEI